MGEYYNIKGHDQYRFWIYNVTENTVYILTSDDPQDAHKVRNKMVKLHAPYIMYCKHGEGKWYEFEQYLKHTVEEALANGAKTKTGGIQLPDDMEEL